MKILGISAYCNNASACIVNDGDIVAAAREERFTRIKGDASFPSNAIDFCLNFSNLDLKDLDAIALHDKPLLRFERLLETHYAFAPKGLKSFLASMPVWIQEKVFLRSLIHKELKKLRNADPRKIKLLFSEHHLSHAASTFYTSKYQEAAILIIDSVGEWATTSICHGHNNKIKIIKELRYPHSLGLLYKSFASFLGYEQWEYQQALSTLAEPGKDDSVETIEFVNKIKEQLARVKKDGSVHLNQSYFLYTTGAHLVNNQKWELLFGLPKREASQELQQAHHNLARAFYIVLEEIIVNLCREAKQLTQSEHLCLAGDVVLDEYVTGIIRASGYFKDVFVQCAPGDDGAALGAALAAQHLYFREKRKYHQGDEILNTCFLGPSFPSEEIRAAIEEGAFQYYKYNDKNTLQNDIAELITQGKVVGIFRGRMEFGTNALGNRSILADPERQGIRQRINTEIKGREAFLPLEISTVEDAGEDTFLQGIILQMKTKTTKGNLLNTGMCSSSEPLVCSPEDAINFFKSTGMDYLVMDCYLISKELNSVKKLDNELADCITS